MDDLIAFVRACLDREEQVAREAANQGGIGRAGEASWHRVHTDRRALTGDMAGNVVIHGLDETWSPSSFQADHIVLHDPASVLADVAVKRAILNDHECVQAGFTWTHPIDHPESQRVPLWICGRCSDRNPDALHGDESHSSHDWPCKTVRLVAQRYAGWPGWRDEWRP